MFEKYLGPLQEMAGGFLSDNNLPTDKASEVVGAGSDAIKDNLLSAATSGNMDGALGFLTGKDDGMSSAIGGSFIENITSRLGIDSGMASGLVSSLLPKAIEMIRGAFTDSDGDNDESNALDFMGMDAGGLMDKAKDMLGGKLGGLFS